MPNGKTIGRKAAKVTLRHSWRGFAAKAQRKPFRSVSLLSAGGLIGAAAGWFAARKTSSTDG
ncbi:MAG TPA: hypothetical protein VMD09_16160 [Solirubrobacteraceae bacterium]|nr:hypothetical protein [Solirubrobacteraceae bacterium]